MSVLTRPTASTAAEYHLTLSKLNLKEAAEWFTSLHADKSLWCIDAWCHISDWARLATVNKSQMKDLSAAVEILDPQKGILQGLGLELLDITKDEEQQASTGQLLSDKNPELSNSICAALEHYDKSLMSVWASIAAIAATVVEPERTFGVASRTESLPASGATATGTAEGGSLVSEEPSTSPHASLTDFGNDWVDVPHGDDWVDVPHPL